MADPQEPPGGWDRAAAPAYPSEAYAVKRSLGRVAGFMALSFALYQFYWFYVTRKLVDGELADERDDAPLHTVGLIVPVLNVVIAHRLWRDLNLLRARVGLPRFPAVPYAIGSFFLPFLFWSLILPRFNEYWDVRTQGLATEAPVTVAEKAVVAVGVGLWILLLALAVLVLVVIVGISSLD